jgi:hypothetical protein
MKRSASRLSKKLKTMRNPKVVEIIFVQDGDRARTEEVKNLIAQMIILGREKQSPPKDFK